MKSKVTKSTGNVFADLGFAPEEVAVLTLRAELMVMNVQEAVDAPKFHQQWLPETTNVENFALSPDSRKILEGWGQKFSGPQPANHLAAILVGAPTLGGKPVGNNKFYGANDPRRNTGLALGY